MTRQAYPTDLNDTQWALIAPLLPQRQSARGRPRSWTDRDIVDAILYIVRGGCGWRRMPHDLPPWQTAYGYYWHWRNSGLWEQINAVLVKKVRVQQGREPQPSAGSIDSQSVKSSEGGEARGVDVYKQVSGRKHHVRLSQRVFEAEAGQEVVPIEFGTFHEKWDAKRRVILLATLSPQRFKLVNVQPEVSFRTQANFLAIRNDPALTKGVLDFPQCMPQVCKGFGLFVVRSKQRTQGNARVLASIFSKIRQQYHHFASLGRDRRVIQIQ